MERRRARDQGGGGERCNHAVRVPPSVYLCVFRHLRIIRRCPSSAAGTHGLGGGASMLILELPGTRWHSGILWVRHTRAASPRHLSAQPAGGKVVIRTMTARKNKTRNKKKTRKEIRSRAIKGVLRLAMFDGWEQVRCAPGNRVRQPSASSGRRAAHAHLPASRSGCHRGPRRRGRSPSRGPRGYPVPLSGRRAQACGRRLVVRFGGWGGWGGFWHRNVTRGCGPPRQGTGAVAEGPADRTEACGARRARPAGARHATPRTGRCASGDTRARYAVRTWSGDHDGEAGVRGGGGGAGAVVHAAVRGADDRRRGRRGRGARTLPGRHGDAAPPPRVL